MDKKTVNKMLEGAKKQDFIEIITKMSVLSADAEQMIIDWCKKHNEKNKMHAIEMELKNLWMRAEEILEEFNMYGGGPESDEEDAADCLWKIASCAKEQEVSWDVRRWILDGLLEEFNVGNSGFDDLLIDIASSLCKTKEEKRYFADALASGSDEYYKGYAAYIVNKRTAKRSFKGEGMKKILSTCQTSGISFDKFIILANYELMVMDL